jgi:hypothetical protein
MFYRHNEILKPDYLKWNDALRLSTEILSGLRSIELFFTRSAMTYTVTARLRRNYLTF